MRGSAKTDEVPAFELPRGATSKHATLAVKGVTKQGPNQPMSPPPAIARCHHRRRLLWRASTGYLRSTWPLRPRWFAKRQTISSQDVVIALKSLRFDDMLMPCSSHLEMDRANRPKHAPTLKEYRGVYQGSINAWYSQISIAGQPIHLGSFAAPEDAARAYDRAIWSKLGIAAGELLNVP